ncbi:MAG: hypothetical protein AAFV59_14965, partial [Pseudomonadota bacterium]
MNALKRMTGAVVGTACAYTFAAGVAGTVFVLLSSSVPAIENLTTELRCAAGVPPKGAQCVEDEIAAAKSAQAAAEDAIAAQNFVFEPGPHFDGGMSVVVGTIYRNAASRTGPIRSFCWAIVDRGGLDPRIGLAIKEPGGAVKPLDVIDVE